MVLTTEQFTVTLPSNSNLQTHPNTPADYTVQLRTPKDLAGGKWEAAILSMHYPLNWSNVDFDTEVRVFFFETTVILHNYEERTIAAKWHNNTSYPNDVTLEVEGKRFDYVYCKLTIPSGYYSSVTQIGERIASAFKNMYQSQLVAPPPVEYIYNVAESRGRFVLGRGSMLILTENDRLAKLLGHDTTRMVCEVSNPVVRGSVESVTLRSMDTFASTPPAVQFVDSLYVYCDFIEDQAVGDADAKLLGIVPMLGPYGQRSYWTFVPPIFAPVSKRHLTTLRIRIRNDRGNPIRFATRSANVVCCVCFRPCPKGI